MTTKKSMQFKTEVNQILNLMINSLYSNKEIFLRELTSNSADACDKLRFEAISNDSLYEGDSELQIKVTIDEEAGTLSIHDNGIGMNAQEVMDNIGTIANSGTKKFLEQLGADQAKDANMIGQFGVGFYASFIVADKVTLETRRAGDATSEGTRWESDSKDGYTIETIEKANRGTTITLHLKDEVKSEYTSDWTLRSIIRKYSDHIAFPVMMLKVETPAMPSEDENETIVEEEKAPVWETVNKANALWTRSKKEIKDEEYQEFYKHISHDFQDALSWSHNKVEGTLEYSSLLYIPSKAPFDLYEAETKSGLKLYVQRVFIMDDSKNLMPRYLRFVRGIIDSNDLPLNVSREILQSNKVIQSMKKASTKKVLGLLEDMAENSAEQYQEFWKEFGQVMKEGVGEDTKNKEKIAGLLRFTSSVQGSEEQTLSLKEYVERMKEGQDEIYFISAESYNAAKNSPHMEVFRQKGIEVLLLSDRVDEWLTSHLTEFDGKKLHSISKGDLDLSTFDSEEEKTAQAKMEEDSKEIVNLLKAELKEKVEDVRVSHRLTNSPSCVVLNEKEMALYMQQMLKQAGHDVPTSKPVLEINPSHPLLNKISASKEDGHLSDWASILFDQAILAEGGQLEDPAGFVSKMNQLML